MQVQSTIAAIALALAPGWQHGRSVATRLPRHAVTMATPSSMVAAPFIERLTPHATTQPVLLFLPDIDFTSAAIRNQLDGLRSDWDVRVVTTSADDRTGIDDLGSLIAAAIDEEPKGTYLVGDAFGGVLALHVALQERPSNLRGLVLVNPATSVELSSLPQAMPALDALVSAPTVLSALFTPALAATAALVNRPARLDDLARLVPALPLPTLRFRLQMMRDASATVTKPSTLARLTLPVEIYASTNDRLLPSADEGRRLARDMPNARLRLLQGAGHSPLLEAGGASLGALLKSAALTERTPRSRVDYVGKFSPPSAEAFKNASASLENIRRLASPVFVSTTADGRRIAGAEALKSHLGATARNSSRGVLLVGNHQLIGPDISMLIEEVYWATGALVRGLSHPSNFRVSGTDAADDARVTAGGGGDGVGGADAGGDDAGGGGFGNFNAKFGAVPVSARALVRLMSSGEAALLYPGGLREAFKSTKPSSNEAYKLLWPPVGDGSFARVAARFDATIVPVAAIGADECFEMLLDADDVLALPLLGARAKETALRTPIALPGERFVTPVSLPAPWRFRRFCRCPTPTRTPGLSPRLAFTL